MTVIDEQERPYVDPGHALPDEDWAAVVRRAGEVREEVRGSAGGGASGPGGIILDMTALGIASKKYFPVSGIPTQLLVLHSAECPLKGGYAKALSEWACGTVHPAPPLASWQRFVDPIHRVRLVPDELGAWAASEANTLSISWEQAGYARFTRDQWLTADGLVQLEMLALDMAEVAVRDGIPARWLSDWEVRQVLDHGNRSIKGFCNHRQIDPETRTDPGDGYPYDLLMERIIFYMGGGSPAADPIEEDEDMLTIARDTGVNDGKIWIGNAMFRRHIPDPATLDAIQVMAEEGAIKLTHPPREVQNWPQEAMGFDLAGVVVAEVRAHAAHAANRVLDALAASPSVDLPEGVLAELRAGIKEQVEGLEIVLRANGGVS